MPVKEGARQARGCGTWGKLRGLRAARKPRTFIPNLPGNLPQEEPGAQALLEKRRGRGVLVNAGTGTVATSAGLRPQHMLPFLSEHMLNSSSLSLGSHMT